MGYVVKDLDEEEKKNNGDTGGIFAPSAGTSAPRQGVASIVAPQQTAQQKRGTGFIDLSEWLNAGQGRDQAISSTGTSALDTEKSKFKSASDSAESGLNSNHVLTLKGDASTALDRESGIGNGLETISGPAPKPAPEPSTNTPVSIPHLQTGIAGVMSPPDHGTGGLLERIGRSPIGSSQPIPPPSANMPTQSKPISFPASAINLNPIAAPPVISGPITSPKVISGPTISDVVGQHYTGPSSIDYQAGDDFQKAKMLGDTSTVADVLGKDAIAAGQYTSGMRALDNLLYGADSASQSAINANKVGAESFQKDAIAKGADFDKRAQQRADDMADAAGRTREALTKIGDDTKVSLQKRADAANAAAQAHFNSTDSVYDPNTGRMEKIGPDKILGGWTGDKVGSANIGNVQTDDEKKRFAKLQELLGYSAPASTGTYKEGSRQLLDAQQPISSADEKIFSGLSEGNKPDDYVGYLENIYNNTDFLKSDPDVVSAMYKFLHDTQPGRDVESSLEESFTPEQLAALWRYFVKKHGGK
jgi:hypothetical protein